ncbi:MAG: hypothetical protein KBA28_05980 [Syntrophaceae bacterium]|nr:hypothetical protein [Syntrophaceae bacterium]
MQKMSHHVRLGPGKGVAFGRWQYVPAGANGLICIPEGKDRFPSGEVVPVQLI